MSGKKFINISAATILFKIFFRIVRNINSVLESLAHQSSIEESNIKKFIISSSKLDLAEYILYSAMEADEKSLYFQQEKSEDWNIIKDMTEFVPV